MVVPFKARGRDEDIIGSNMTMPTTSILKVQPFYMRLIIDAFDELVLHHKMCIFLFANYVTSRRAHELSSALLTDHRNFEAGICGWRSEELN